MSNSDHQYLTAITGTIIGAPESDARAQVDDAVNHVRSAKLCTARIAAVLQAFFVAAALLVGAVIAWHAATEGGKDREQRHHYNFWDWSPGNGLKRESWSQRTQYPQFLAAHALLARLCRQPLRKARIRVIIRP